MRRLLGAVPLVLGIATLVFVVLQLAPGDPAIYLLRPGMTAEVVAQMRTNFGLDDPLPVRYLKWLAALFTGDFGYSYSHGRPALDVLAQILPNTLLLSGLALVLSFVAGTLLGTLQAVRRGSKLDTGLNAVLLFFYSMPSFWLALMLVLAFAVHARISWDWPFWFPVSGMTSVEHDLMGFWARLGDRLAHLALPVLSLSLVLTAGIARFMRSSMLEVLGQDYIRTARAKGLPERTVVLKHALRNALLPMITLLGLHVPLLLSGTVFIETVFSWPGMGKTVVDAILARDYALVMAGTFLFAAMVVFANLLADVLYAVADPRVRHG